jgi:hypothetical protein
MDDYPDGILVSILSANHCRGTNEHVDRELTERVRGQQPR